MAGAAAAGGHDRTDTIPSAGTVSTSEYLPALAAKACALGVEIREYEKVSGFIRRGGRIAGVKTGHGDLEADVVISTVYSWTRALLEQIDLPLPGEMFRAPAVRHPAACSSARHSRRECESLWHLLPSGHGRPSPRRHRNARARGVSGEITRLSSVGAPSRPGIAEPASASVAALLT